VRIVAGAMLKDVADNGAKIKAIETTIDTLRKDDSLPTISPMAMRLGRHLPFKISVALRHLFALLVFADRRFRLTTHCAAAMAHPKRLWVKP
jgi:hypothetical protein